MPKQQEPKQKGIPCLCGKGGLVPMFTYTGDNYTLTRVPNMGYCRACGKAYKMNIQEVI